MCSSGIAVVSSIATSKTASLSWFQLQVSHNTNAKYTQLLAIVNYKDGLSEEQLNAHQPRPPV